MNSPRRNVATCSAVQPTGGSAVRGRASRTSSPFAFRLDPVGVCLFSFSTPGQKIDWMRENPKVCVEVDEMVDQFNWTSVLAFGRYEEIRDTRQDEDLRRQANALFQQRTAWWLPALGKLASAEEHHSSIVYRILIDKLTGRQAHRPG